MSDNTPKLEPCPVCGGEVHSGDGSTFRWVIITCQRCDSMWEVRENAMPDSWNSQRQHVIEAMKTPPMTFTKDEQ